MRESSQCPGSEVIETRPFMTDSDLPHSLEALQVTASLSQSVKELNRRFPSWEPEVLRDVLRDVGGDLKKAKSLLGTWTAEDESGWLPSESDAEGKAAAAASRCRPGDVLVAVFDFVAHSKMDLNLRKGDQVTVLETEPDGWWKGRSQTGEVGWFPYNVTSGWRDRVAEHGCEKAEAAASRCLPGTVLVAVADFAATSDVDLPLRKGDRVTVLSTEPDGWWHGRNAEGQIGWFPYSFTSIDAKTSEDATIEAALAASLEESIAPQVVERADRDKMLQRRLTWKVSPKAMTTVALALSSFKARAAQARAAAAAHPGTKVAGPVDVAQPVLSREEAILEGKALLAERLKFMKCREIQMKDDGNCLFRAVSYELYGDQRYHRFVRSRVVGQMRDHHTDYQCFVGDDAEWKSYIEKMQMDRTWGDEIALRAASDVFGVPIHLVTTELENWHTVYEPGEKRSPRLVFLCYIAPIHYNVIGVSR